MPTAMKGTIINMDKSGHAKVLLRAGVVLKTAKPVTGFAVNDRVLASINFAERNIKNLFTEEPAEELPEPEIVKEIINFAGSDMDEVED